MSNHKPATPLPWMVHGYPVSLSKYNRAIDVGSHGIVCAISGKPKVCPVCEDSACETKSEECGK